MANSFRGEITVDFRGRTATVAMNMNTLADFQQATGKDAFVWLTALEQGGASLLDIREMVCAALCQREPEATLRDAGDLLSEHPDILMRLLAAAVPQGDAEGNALPAPAKAGRRGK